MTTRRWPAALGPLVITLVLAGLACCSSLPTIVPDLSHRARAPVPLTGPHGPLTPERSKAVLDALAARSPATDIFTRHLALEEALVGSPLTVGNEVLLLQDGPATYRAMLAAIQAAQDHIHMETYILDDDEVGQRFAEALLAKRRQGVQVQLIRDSAGTLGTPAAFFQHLVDGGVQVLEFNPMNPLRARRDWELNQRDHRKLLIVDGRVAFLGGINISSVYSGGSLGPSSRRRPDGSLAWRDTDLQLRGPAVADLQRLFLATWAAQQGPALPARNYFPPVQPAGPLVVRVIGSSPEEPFSLIYATLLSAIGSAETSIQITNAYFVPDPQLLVALESAARRGVAVTLILPSTTDSWLVFHAGRAHYERLLRAGVNLHERHGAILHAKTALIDGVWATVGSTNLDWRSFLHNHELNAVVLGPDFGRQLQAMFNRDLAASERLSLAAWLDRPMHLRWSEWFAQVWAYWL
jgi:cardiolipin synthase A/B